jgi:anti-sigma B factor antagonist
MPQEPLAIEDVLGAKNGQRILRLTGPIIINNLFDLQARMRANKTQTLILDFTSVPYIDSAGVGALVGAYVTHQKDGRKLFLVAASERIRNALKVTHVEQFLSFFPTLAEAELAAAQDANDGKSDRVLRSLL